MDRLVRVRMSDLSVQVEAVPSAWASLGGRALTSAIVAAEVSPVSHPLGRGNKLVLAPGLLAGTCTVCSGRLSIGAKSPLTGTIREGNAGGAAARLLAHLGIGALIIEGARDDRDWYSLRIDRTGVRLHPERDLVGQGLSSLADAVDRRCGKAVGMIGIGPAGEMEMPAANLAVKDAVGRVRSVGRGGLGAVLGSKRIKFVSFDDTGVGAAPPAAEVARAFSRFVAALTAHGEVRARLPSGGATLPRDLPVDAMPSTAACPPLPLMETLTRLASAGPEGITQRPGCQPGCVVPCGRISQAGSGYLGHDGATDRIADAQDRATVQRLLDDIGLDSIETGIMFGLAMEAGLVRRGDGKGVIRLLTQDIAKGTPLGRVLGGGTATLRRIYGLSGTSVVKDALPPDATARRRPISPPPTIAADASTSLRIAGAVMDSIGMCLFVGVPALDLPDCRTALVEMIAARLDGAAWDGDLDGVGRQVLVIERQFAAAAGCLDDDAPPASAELSDGGAARVMDGPAGAIWDF